jgi:hypothetical protein
MKIPGSESPGNTGAPPSTNPKATDNTKPLQDTPTDTNTQPAHNSTLKIGLRAKVNASLQILYSKQDSKFQGISAKEILRHFLTLALSNAQFLYNLRN